MSDYYPTEALQKLRMSQQGREATAPTSARVREHETTYSLVCSVPVCLLMYPCATHHPSLPGALHAARPWLAREVRPDTRTRSAEADAATASYSVARPMLPSGSLLSIVFGILVARAVLR